jgi:hypothetical protein
VFIIADVQSAATAETSAASSGSGFTLTAVLGAIIAISGIVFFLRRKRG